MERDEEGQSEVGMPGPKGEEGKGKNSTITDLICRKDLPCGRRSEVEMGLFCSLLNPQ